MKLTLIVLAACAALAGCETLNAPAKVDIAETLYAPPQPVVVPTINNGSIYQAGQYRPLFEDHRARMVGDTITVVITEKVTASQSATSSVDKNGKIEGAVTGLPFIGASVLGKLGVGGSSANSFEGKGATVANNNFSGTITAVVTNVLPNGHLVVAGEKQIGLNHAVDVLRFSGQVDPHVILAGNTVQSAQIANVRIEQRGRGAQAEAQGIGWLARFFLSVLPI